MFNFVWNDISFNFHTFPEHTLNSHLVTTDAIIKNSYKHINVINQSVPKSTFYFYTTIKNIMEKVRKGGISTTCVKLWFDVVADTRDDFKIDE